MASGNAAPHRASVPVRLFRAAGREFAVSFAFLLAASAIFFGIVDRGFLGDWGALPSDGWLPARYVDWQLDALAGEFGVDTFDEPVAPIVQDFLNELPRVGLMFALATVVGGALGTRLVGRGNFRITDAVVAAALISTLTVLDLLRFVVFREWLGLAFLIGVVFVPPMARMTKDRLRSVDDGGWLQLAAVFESASWLVGPYLSLTVVLGHMGLIDLPLWQRWVWVDQTTVLALGWCCIVLNVLAWRLLRFLGHSARLLAGPVPEPEPERGDPAPTDPEPDTVDRRLDETEPLVPGTRG